MAQKSQTQFLFLFLLPILLCFLTLKTISCSTIPLCATLQKTKKVGPSVRDARITVEQSLKNEILQSKGTFSLFGISRYSVAQWRQAHGIISFVSWGILNPMGVLIGTHLRRTSICIYVHACCHISSTILGIFGWTVGIELGSKSHELKYNLHFVLGTTLTCLSTAQIFILFLKPNEDHKYRKYWNNFHLVLGYIITILGILNIFVGIDNSHLADDKWIVPWILLYRIWTLVLVLIGLGELGRWIHDSCNKKSSGPAGSAEKQGYGMVESPTKSGMQLRPLDSVKISEKDEKSPSSS